MNRLAHSALPTMDWAGLLADHASAAQAPLCAALALASEAIQIWDADGSLVLANPASDRLFGPGEKGQTGHDRLYGDCLMENGTPFPPDALPVARILATGEPLQDVMVTMRPSEDDTRWLKLGGQAIRDSDGRLIGAIVTATDITDFIEHRQRLEHLASYDALTQLPNRILLAERARISLARARRNNETVAVCMLDLDGFKGVNDTLGHKAGDELLREVAIRLRESIRGDDTVARIGGDEFALLLCGIHKLSEGEQTLTRLLARIGQPYQLAGQTVKISASAGVALYPGDGSDPDQLLSRADSALYQAKQAGKNRFHFFDRKLDMRLQANRGLLRKIETAIREQQFVLHYQPIVNCREGRVEGVEALIRWQHPVLGLLAPLEFLPLIDQDDLGVAVGEWVVGEALRQLHAWHEKGLRLTLAVNLFARHLLQPDFADWLAARLAEQPAELAPYLTIEVAESATVADISAMAAVLHQCAKLGIGITLDNFGVGYASLLHLRRLMMHTIKIDQSFIQNMLNSPEDLAIVGGVVGFAAPFGCRVTAEGAETIEHLLTLLELGCNVIQGYSLARPMAPDKLEAWLRGFQPDPLWHLASTARPSRDHFELLLAEANFRAWFAHAVDQCKQKRYIDSLSDEHHCPLGKWLARPETRRFRKFDEFRQLERLHALVHSRFRQFGSDHLTGRLDRAKADEETLLEEELRILMLLKNLRGRLGREPRLRAPSSHEET